MKNKTCKKCGRIEGHHYYKNSEICKKFELLIPKKMVDNSNKTKKGCGKVDKENPELTRSCGDILFNNTIWLCKSCKDKNHDYYCSYCSGFFKEPHNHHSPSEVSHISSGGDSPQVKSDSKKSFLPSPEDTLSSKIVSEKAIRTFKEDSGKSWIEDKKVKDFIKKLKGFPKISKFGPFNPVFIELDDFINKEAGAELT